MAGFLRICFKSPCLGTSFAIQFPFYPKLLLLETVRVLKKHERMVSEWLKNLTLPSQLTLVPRTPVSEERAQYILWII